MAKPTHTIQGMLEEQALLLLHRIKDNPNMYDDKFILSCIQIMGMYLTRELKLGQDDSNVGSAVRKYTSAFRTTHVSDSGADGAGQPAKRTRNKPAPFAIEPDESDPELPLNS